jgi:hypothetical protein
MWKKYGTARQATDDNITRRTRFTCWINEATNTRLDYVVLILIALSRRSLLCERTSLLRLYVPSLPCQTHTNHIK